MTIASAIIERASLVDAATYALRPERRGIRFTDIPAHSDAATKAIDGLALQWPEYFLGPSNPLAFLGADMPCKFFGEL
ncbi:hypothetical protein LB543_01255 [Mesorhizobium sp. ESP7-2]|uniref:hypothetical protein n=1 Tax=Mesorhizobium sp. ESP7-2 TaxID=2876622 RepID=UPI001CCE0014|nr:hypothetical protein [Mesorhizobium sp. ESP7-2]MBZ9705356.1 hypothetical protein [Mesorhizobium sp. ESP7-2]